MKLPICSRLLACADFIAPGMRVADIGCDHGYLSIYLLRKGICPSVIAADVRQQPLLRAIGNAEKFGVRDNMQFYLSDGVQAVPHDFDCMVCAGMGGDTMISILAAAPWLKSPKYRLVLQCQSKTPLLRQYLNENGWRIEKEAILRDKRFLYTVMQVSWQENLAPLCAGEFYFPSLLTENPQQYVREYYHRTLKKLSIFVSGHGASADPMKVQALSYLQALPQKPHMQFLKEDNP